MEYSDLTPLTDTRFPLTDRLLSSLPLSDEFPNQSFKVSPHPAGHTQQSQKLAISGLGKISTMSSHTYVTQTLRVLTLAIVDKTRIGIRPAQSGGSASYSINIDTINNSALLIGCSYYVRRLLLLTPAPKSALLLILAIV